LKERRHRQRYDHASTSLNQRWTGYPQPDLQPVVQGRRAVAWSNAFITLSGIVAFLVGALLAGIALIVALVQIVLWRRDASLLRFLPPALGATAAAFLAGLWLLLAAEFRWIPGESLDNLSPLVFAAAVWWMIRNRMGSARNRRERSAGAQSR
jgi:hypothetical protein